MFWGPILFNWYVSHLPGAVSEVKIPSYADDVTVYAISHSLSDSASLVSTEVSDIGLDLQTRGLAINIDKLSAMFLASASTDCSKFHVSFDSVHLNTVFSARLLVGVVIDNRLIWEEHISFVMCKVAKKIGALQRARRMLSPQARKLFLTPVIFPELDYCSSVFGCGVRVRDLLRLEALERRALRICAGAGYSDDCAPLYKYLEIAPLLQRWLLKILCAAFSAIKGLKPPAVQQIFQLSNDSSHGHDTRSKSAFGVRPRRAERLVADRSFGARSAVLWNALPSACRAAPSLPAFRRSLSELSLAAVTNLCDLAFRPLVA